MMKKSRYKIFKDNLRNRKRYLKRYLLRFFGKEKHSYAEKEDYLNPHHDGAFWETHHVGLVLKEHFNFIYGSIADFGCTHGAITEILAKKSNCKHATGFDLNPDAIAAAKKLRSRANLSFRLCDLRKIDAENGSFDSGICLHTLEHIFDSDLDAVLGEIHRVLKINGHFLVIVPYKYAYYDPTHEQFFTLKSLKSLLERNHFKVLSIVRDRRTDAHSVDEHDAIVVTAESI